jgi:hypothetical protein
MYSENYNKQQTPFAVKQVTRTLIAVLETVNDKTTMDL